MSRFIGTVIRLSLMVMAGLCGFAELQLIRAQEESDSAAQGQIPSDLVWNQVTPSAKLAILELLSTHTRSNYERIMTWTATYSVHLETYLSPSFVMDAFAERLPKDSTPALINESQFTFKVAIEMESGAVFRERDTIMFRLLTTDTRKSIVIPGVAPDDNRSIVTSEHWVYFPYKDPPLTYAVLPDHPEAQNKRAAHRVPAEGARNQHYGELIDPRLFFRCATPSMSWEELDLYASMLQGKHGAEKQRKATERLRIDEATHGGSTWYRFELLITFPDGRDNMVTSIWSPFAGLNPISLTFTAQGEDEGAVRESVSWQWKSMDGIFVPVFISEVWHPKEPGDIDTFRRIVELKECSLNQPLPRNQFTYAALGLKAGDLILDEIENVVYIMRDGKPEKLAEFGEKYVPREAAVQGMSLARRLLVGVNFIVLAVVLVIIWYKRCKARAARIPQWSHSDSES